MILGLDYNGVISERREQYKKLAEFFLSSGGKVYVVSHWTPPRTRDDFYSTLGDFPYTDAFINEEECSAPEWKSAMCEHLKVDMFIDDKIIICSEINKKGILTLVAT